MCKRETVDETDDERDRFMVRDRDGDRHTGRMCSRDKKGTRTFHASTGWSMASAPLIPPEPAPFCPPHWLPSLFG